MELIKLLPDYYQDNETMATLQSVLSEETDKLDAELKITVNQVFSSADYNTAFQMGDNPWY